MTQFLVLLTLVIGIAQTQPAFAQFSIGIRPPESKVDSDKAFSMYSAAEHALERVPEWRKKDFTIIKKLSERTYPGTAKDILPLTEAETSALQRNLTGLQLESYGNIGLRHAENGVVEMNSDFFKLRGLYKEFAEHLQSLPEASIQTSRGIVRNYLDEVFSKEFSEMASTKMSFDTQKKWLASIDELLHLESTAPKELLPNFVFLRELRKSVESGDFCKIKGFQNFKIFWATVANIRHSTEITKLRENIGVKVITDLQKAAKAGNSPKLAEELSGINLIKGIEETTLVKELFEERFKIGSSGYGASGGLTSSALQIKAILSPEKSIVIPLPALRQQLASQTARLVKTLPAMEESAVCLTENANLNKTTAELASVMLKAMRYGFTASKDGLINGGKAIPFLLMLVTILDDQSRQDFVDGVKGFAPAMMNNYESIKKVMGFQNTSTGGVN